MRIPNNLLDELIAKAGVLRLALDLKEARGELAVMEKTLGKNVVKPNASD